MPAISSRSGQQWLSLHQSLILKTIKTYLVEQDILKIDESMDRVVIYRSMNDLHDYIFDVDSYRNEGLNAADDAQEYDIDSLKRFDYIDFVIMDIDSSILPWQKKAKQLSMLFQMCKIAQKPVLATGAGMAQIVAYCATLKVHKMEVINGKERGGRK